ncbi:hypothetical protein AHAS_Ahas03G0191000 [Arachis hypogaea]
MKNTPIDMIYQFRNIHPTIYAIYTQQIIPYTATKLRNIPPKIGYQNNYNNKNSNN